MMRMEFVQHHNEVSKYTHMTLNKYLSDLFGINEWNFVWKMSFLLTPQT